MNEAGQVLNPGEVISYDGLSFHVERVEKRRVMRVRLEVTEKKEEPQEVNAANSAGRVN
jgi:CBS domain containing-hemolysin-like protein